MDDGMGMPVEGIELGVALAPLFVEPPSWQALRPVKPTMSKLAQVENERWAVGRVISFVQSIKW